MKKSFDYQPFIPTLDYPRVKAMHGRTAHEHGVAGYANPLPRSFLFDPWEALYQQPFVGVTTDGKPLPGLFSLGDHNAPTAAMIDAATHLIAAATADERRALMLPIDAREWRNWNNTEMYVYKYGLRLEEVSVPLRDAMLAVVRASLSARGYDKTRDVMRLNHFLGELAMNTKVLGEWSFNFALFGTPSTTEPWGWQMMGHHLALNCLVIGGQMALTPAFMGAEPNYADTGPFKGTHLFQDEENGGLAMIRALSPAQQQAAIQYHSTTDQALPAGRRHRADQLHLGGAFQDNRVVPYQGAPVAEFTQAQKKRLLELINAYVEPLPGGPLTTRMEEVERHLDETHFHWIGGTGEDDTFYYRIQSPVVMIEFDHHSGVFLTNELPAKFHIHTIVRTPNGNDYGMDWLRLHYARDHHEGTRPGVQTDAAEHKQQEEHKPEHKQEYKQVEAREHGIKPQQKRHTHHGHSHPNYDGHSHDHAHGDHHHD